MKNLFKKILLLIIILITIDFCVGLILNVVLVNSPDGRYFKAEYSLGRSTEDIIVFGSSRAETNYAPYIFEDSLKLTCWNTGRGGQTLPFWYAMEQGILSRYTPKIAIVNVERDFLSDDLSFSYEHSGFLRPFYYNHPEIRTVINKISKFERLLLLSKTYAYNSSFYYLFRPYLIKGLDGDREDNGWKTKHGIIQKSESEPQKYKTNFKLSQNTLELFEIFINDLTNKGCKVYVVVSPNYGHFVESTATINHIKAMKDIKFINFSNDSLFIRNNEYFKDNNHLNVNGAIEFSKHVSNEILKLENKVSTLKQTKNIVQ